MALNDREAYYQTQIRELQARQDQSLLETKDLQSQLAKLREEKTANKNQYLETMNTLKQDYENLQNELHEKGNFHLFYYPIARMVVHFRQ